MPTDLFLKTANTMHRALLKVSGGRAGWTAGSMPVLQLTTTGRKSGQPRTVMLTSPYQDGDTIVLIYRSTIEPDFWVPPLIGSSILRAGIRRKLISVSAEIERRAAQETLQ